MACSGGDGSFRKRVAACGLHEASCPTGTGVPEGGEPRSGDPGLGFTLFQAPAASEQARTHRVLRTLHVQVRRASERAVGVRRGLHQRNHSDSKRNMPLQKPTKA